MRHLDLFSGIGGFALAASWVWPDHEVVAFCDNEDFCRKVLNKHWPDHEVVAFCDNEDFCRKVLNKHWPDVPVIDDI